MREKRRPPRRLGMTVLIALLSPIIAVYALVYLVLYLFYLSLTYFLVWALWLLRGKDILFVYSDSPIWQEYMTTQILPRVQERAVVLNWSERSQWSRWSFRTHAFHFFGENREFNPLVVLFRPFRRAQTFRFWGAFKDWKHGNKETVERLSQELFSALQPTEKSG